MILYVQRGSYIGNANEFEEYLLKDMARNAVLEDSRNYLHVVPWSDLKSISWQSVESSTEIDDPFDDIRPNNRISGYMLWELPDEASKWLSHLRTEEEVLQYCMAKDWPLPGHLYIDKAASALFALKPIEDTLLLQQLDQFWDLWVSSSVLSVDLAHHVCLTSRSRTTVQSPSVPTTNIYLRWKPFQECNLEAA